MKSKENKRISVRSTKQEIWKDRLRLEKALTVAEQRLIILDRRAVLLEQENRHLADQKDFVEGLRRRLAESNERLTLVAQFTRDVISLDRERIYELAMRRIPFIFRASCASIYLLDDEHKKLFLKRNTHDRPIEQVVHLAEPRSSLMASVIQTGNVEVVSEISRFDRLGEHPYERPFQKKYRTESCIIAPLRVGKRVIGVLNLADPSTDCTFSTSRDRPLMTQVSEVLALAIANAQLFDQVERQAKTDPLTRLANQPFFFKELEREIERAERYGGELSLIVADIDGFRLINENFGHRAGDLVLESVARRIRTIIRAVDVAARLGPDEFGVILPAQDLSGAEKVAARIIEQVKREEVKSSDRTIALTVSAGIAQHTSGVTASEFARLAEKALEEARRDGGDRASIR